MYLHKYAVCQKQLARYTNYSYLFSPTGKPGNQQQQFDLYIRDGKRLRRMCVYYAFTEIHSGFMQFMSETIDSVHQLLISISLDG